MKHFHRIDALPVAFALLLGVVAGGCGSSEAPPATAPQSSPTPAAKTEKASVPAKPVFKQASVANCTGRTPLKPGVPGSPGHLIPSEINPNGHSELAVLMRMMQKELGEVRKAVSEGKPARLNDKHHRIRCAWPTSSSDHTAAFDAMAVSYLHAVDRFNDPTDKAPAKERFNAVVDACLSCHANMCGGPMVAIRPLKLP